MKKNINIGERHGRLTIIMDFEDFITSLQREQPEQTCKSCGFYENNCPFIRGKLIPYPNKVCKDYTYSAMKEQEQPEVDLEKEAVSYCFDNGINISPRQAKAIARHFYELGLNARKEK